MRALDHKLWRDMWGMRGQVFAIFLVIASGIAIFVLSHSTADSLRLTQATFYQNYHFAEVFAPLKRAPEGLRLCIKEIPGVAKVETRVVATARLEVEGFLEPIIGRLISIPDDGRPLLNRLYLRKGRIIVQYQDDEVMVSEQFALAHGLEPGDRLHAVIKGWRKSLTIVGIVLSPEYIYQLAPGAMIPDFERFGVLWMGRTPLAAAYGMEGAFNDVTLTLLPQARANDVIHRLDMLLEPYGGLGAYDRDDQLSHRFISLELEQLELMATIYPAIFLGVAAFLLSVVIGRLVSTQRKQIAALKAFGYRNLDIGIHYLKFVSLIVLIGTIGGSICGAWLGRGLAEIYMIYFHFPFLEYRLRPDILLGAASIAAAAAIIGTLFAVRKAVMLPPAEAMRPEPPERYRKTLIDRLDIKNLLTPTDRMIVRYIAQRPRKTLLSVIGIAFACAIVMMGGFFEDSVNRVMDVQFKLAQREDISVVFIGPTSKGALFELQGLAGVQHVEVFRSLPVRLKFKHRSHGTVIHGVAPAGNLRRLLDAELHPIELPPAGIVLTDHLGKILGVRPGDRLIVEVLEGDRPIREVPVVAFVSQYIGVSAYMDIAALNRFMREGNIISGAYIAIDPLYQAEIYNALKEMPRIAGITSREDLIARFNEIMEEFLLAFIFFITLFAVIIAFSVVYNNARISLSERSRELASLRVLGFTRQEISYILLGEFALLTLVAIPLGFLIGYGLCAFLVAGIATDLFRIPLVLEPDTYAFAAAVILISACISGLIVRRRLDHLDMGAVLKSEE